MTEKKRKKKKRKRSAVDTVPIEQIRVELFAHWRFLYIEVDMESG